MDKLISTKDAAARCGYSQRHIRLLAQLGRIKGAKLIAGRWLLEVDEVAALSRRRKTYGIAGDTFDES